MRKQGSPRIHFARASVASQIPITRNRGFLVAVLAGSMFFLKSVIFYFDKVPLVMQRPLFRSNSRMLLPVKFIAWLEPISKITPPKTTLVRR